MSPEATLSLEAAIRRFLDSLARPARILVAISGGSDSTGLLLALAEAIEAIKDSDISFCAATVDHALRPQSADEARQVAALCAAHGIPHMTCIWQGDKPATGIMAAAREARYGLLADAAAAFGASLIVTGHTLDDQAETLRMRRLRAEQASIGIADAILFARRIWIMRPLLSTARADIRDFLKACGVGWLDDPSNEDIKYERVRTRRQIAGEGGASAWTKADETERLQLSDRAGDWVNRHVRLYGGALGHIEPEGLKAERRVLDYALGRLTAVFGGQVFAPGREPLQRILDFVDKGAAGRMTAGRVVFDIRRDGLYLARESRGILPLALRPGESGVWDGRFTARNGSRLAVRVEAAANFSTLIPVPVTTIQPPRIGAVNEWSERARVSLAPKDLSALDSCDEHRNEGERGKRLPKAAWKRAMAASPCIVDADNQPLPADLINQIVLSPYFAPFDRFLTRFDRTFANSLSSVFARAPYAEPPLRSIDGKTI